MCTCGDRALSLRASHTREVTTRYIRQPGDTTTYWPKELSVIRGKRSLFCTSCGRERRGVPTGGGTVFEHSVGEDGVSIAMVDVEDVGCMVARYISTSGSYVVSIDAQEPTTDNLAPFWHDAEWMPAPSEEAQVEYIYQVPLPNPTVPGLYKLVLFDHCLGISQYVDEIQLGGLRTLYGRTGHVVAEPFDYAASQVLAGGQPLSTRLSALYVALQARAAHAGDLGGDIEAPLAVALQGRALHDEFPGHDADLSWSGANQRWELSSLPPPALTPTLYEPLAQWALQGWPNLSAVYHDRSGNNRHLTSGSPYGARDLIEGQRAITPRFSSRLQRAADPGLRTTGAMTFTCRLKRVRARYGAVAVYSGIFGAGATQNTLYSLGIDAGGVPSYFYEATTGNGISWAAAGLVVPLFEWVFFSFRRAASGVVTIGVNDTYVTSTALTPPPAAGGTNAFLTLGDQDEAADNHFYGVLADAGIWGRMLTNLEMDPLYRPAMGR
jgi:hypothetical protein